jgi:hypothetical protein
VSFRFTTSGHAINIFTLGQKNNVKVYLHEQCFSCPSFLRDNDRNFSNWCRFMSTLRDTEPHEKHCSCKYTF